jgi:two-component sensor histidine kinase
MTGSNVASEIALATVLHVGSRRILAERSPFAAFDIESACDVTVSTGQAARILAVLREAILNSIDYAHPAGVPGRILLSSAREPDGSIRVEVADDGVGLPEGFDPERDGGHGFRTMRRAGAELGAELSFRSSCLGLAVGLILPTSPNLRSASS